MAILRSRSQPVEVPHASSQPAVAQGIVEWRQRVEAARQEGRGLGLKDAEVRIQAAEARAQQAEQTAQAGITKAKADAEAQLGGAIAALNKATAALPALHRQLVQEAEADSVRLACALAARILGRAVAEDPAWMAGVIAQALTQVPDRRAVAVRLHPSDAAAAREQIAAIGAAAPGVEGLQLIEDAALVRGACVIASQGTRLDAGIPASFDRLAAELFSMVPKPSLTEPVA